MLMHVAKILVTAGLVGSLPVPGHSLRRAAEADEEVVVLYPRQPPCRCVVADAGSANPGSTCSDGSSGPYFTVVTFSKANGPCATIEGQCETQVNSQCEWVVDATLRWPASPPSGCNTVCLKGGNLGPPAFITVASPATPTIRVTAHADCKKDIDNSGNAHLEMWVGSCQQSGGSPPGDPNTPNLSYILSITCPKCKNT